MGKRILLMKYILKDLKHARALRKQGIKPFNDFGLTLFTGRQGAGKTMSMVYEAISIHSPYKGCNYRKRNKRVE